MKINIDDCYMNVIKFGHGSKNLVIIAGISLTGLEGSGEGISQAYSLLSDDYTVWVFDRKNILSENYTVFQMADDIYKVLLKLGVNFADFIGMSQGGMIAMCLAVKYGEVVNKLILCSSSLKISDESYKVFSNWKMLSDKGDTASINKSFAQTVYSEDYVLKYADIFKSLENTGTPSNCKRFSILCQSIMEFDLPDDYLKKIKCPVFVIGSENDKVFGSKASPEIAKKLMCDIFMYTEYSHAVYDEADDFKIRFLKFLNK